jgi:hypothetical protein
VKSGRAGRTIEVVELDERARRGLARRYPAIKGFGTAILVAVATDVRDAMGASIRSLADAANHGRRLRLERLVDSLSPPAEVPDASTVEQARRQAQLRVRLLRDFGARTSAQVSELNGSSASNRSQLAYRWRKEGRIFAVTHRGRSWYLGFQFDANGQPLPGVAAALEHLGHWPEWDIATWFVMSNATLERQRPVDLLADAPDVVGLAAMREVRASCDSQPSEASGSTRR